MTVSEDELSLSIIICIFSDSYMIYNSRFSLVVTYGFSLATTYFELVMEAGEDDSSLFYESLSF